MSSGHFSIKNRGGLIKAFSFVGLLIFLNLLLPSNVSAQDNYLAQYEWKNRIILLLAKHPNAETEKQVTKFRSEWEGMEDRDLKIFLVLPEKASEIKENQQKELPAEVARQLNDKYGKSSEDFQYILIGKDGTIKLSENRQVPNQKLFSTIDAMPMRQREMRRKK